MTKPSIFRLGWQVRKTIMSINCEDRYSISDISRILPETFKGQQYFDHIICAAYCTLKSDF